MMIYHKLLFVFAIYPLLLAANASYVNANPRYDWSEGTDRIPGAPECFIDGYDDGLDHPFDQGRHKECIFELEGDRLEPYYNGFIYACKSVEGNTKDICERFTDQ